MKIGFRLASAFLAFALFGALCSTEASAQTLPAANGWPAMPRVPASAVVVMDAGTGQVLAAFRPHRRQEPASLAKMMTFLLALKAIRSGRIASSTPILIGKDAWLAAENPQYSNMFLEIGTQVPLGKLLLGLMVSSGDDAAIAIADGLNGGVQPFVAGMNAEAKTLGLSHTHFDNPSGLGAPTQRTDALDMANLARHLITDYPEYRQFTTVQWFTWNKIRQRNFNHLVGVDPSVTGLKSGHLGGPNFHLVTTATRHGTTLIVSLFGAPTLDASASETETLLNWAFATFHTVAVPSGKIPSRIPVYEGARPNVTVTSAVPKTGLTLPRAWPGHLRLQVTLGQPVVAPVSKGTRLGQVTVLAAGRVIFKSPLVAARSVARGDIFAVLAGQVALFIRHLFAHVFGHIG